MTELPDDSVEALVLDKLKERYPGLVYHQYFDSGSTARVYHVALPLGKDIQARVDRIIKVFRHDGKLAKRVRPSDVFQNEINILASITDSNLINIQGADFLEIDGIKTPYYLMEYLNGAQDLDKWLVSNREGLTSDLVVDLLLQAAKGIQILHDNDVIHCDIKSGNLLVGEGGNLKVADLGFAKVVDREKNDATCLFTTFINFPERYKEYIARIDDTRHAVAEIPRENIGEDFDIHYFHHVILNLLKLPEVASIFPQRDLRMLRDMARRMDLDAESLLPKYASFAQIVKDLEKLERTYLDRAGVKELSSYTGTRTIRIPVSGSIPFPVRVEKVISHPLFLRLHGALQLGFTYLVFPGARHTRFEHSLGVFANTARYINSLLSDDYQPFFRQLIDEEKIATTLLAGLIHDVGQHSFAHGLEDVSLAEHHEFVAKAFITGEGLEQYVPEDLYEEDGALLEIIEEWWPEVKLERLIWMITGKHTKGLSVDAGWTIMREVINGPIDADKTDYLLRDAHHAGVEYARSIDITRFMNSLTASVVEGHGGNKQGVLAITWKGAQSAENVILARTQMFWVLYWHHAIRSAHAMFAHAVGAHLGEGDEDVALNFRRALYSRSIEEMLSLLQSSPSERASYLARMLESRRLFKRGIELDYVDEGALYNYLVALKDESEKADDPLLLKMSEGIAEAINYHLAEQKVDLRLTREDVIVDIPKSAKDKLGRIYVLEKDAESARPHESKGLAGFQDDWQNKVRTIRIFLDPRVDKSSRETIRKAGHRILNNL